MVTRIELKNPVGYQHQPVEMQNESGGLGRGCAGHYGVLARNHPKKILVIKIKCQHFIKTYGFFGGGSSARRRDFATSFTKGNLGNHFTRRELRNKINM